MMFPEDEIVVLDLAGDHARIFCRNPPRLASLVGLGFQVDGELLIKDIPDDAERQRLVHDLIQLRAVFSVGRDWSPAELLDYYREQGIVSGTYRTISWKSQNEFLVREVR